MRLPFFSKASPAPAALPRLFEPDLPGVVYAIGDVHGCLDDLKRLEQRVAADAAGIEGNKLIVMLGDYIDRGPKSAETLDWLMRTPPAGFRRICLRGNHEALFLAAIERPGDCADWLNWGGLETLSSYGIDAAHFERSNAKIRSQMLQACVPDEHHRFLSELPTLLGLPELVFVHAGVRPGVSLDQQADRDLMWIREPFLHTPHGLDFMVIHGHTPAPQPDIHPHRIGIDTFAYGGGVLSAVRLIPNSPVAVLTS